MGVKPELALDPESARKSAGIINSNMEAINSLWAGYFTNIVDEKENQLGKDFVGAHEKFAEQALKPIVSALKILNYQDTKEHARVALDLLTVVNADIDKLVDFQFTSAQSKNIAAGSRFETLRITFAIFMGGVLFLMGWLGHFILRGYSRSLTAVLNICEAMERGEFDNVIEEKGSDEFSQIATALKSSQAEINRFSEESMLIKLALDKASVGIIIVNNDRIITYINAKAILFLRHVEADIRKLVPQFNGHEY